MKLPIFPNPPQSLDPSFTYRENLIEADCETLERMLKVATVLGFTVYCDESERVGGEHTAPSPLGDAERCRVASRKIEENLVAMLLLINRCSSLALWFAPS